MAATHSVHVANLAETTTEKNLSDFFTFCGKIASIDFNSAAKTATIHFENPSAAKTALMLNGGTLDGSAIAVTSEVEHEDPPHPEHHDETTPIQQSDKPRAAIAAEYLAKGYTLSDQILQKAIDMDKKQGISQRFLNYLRSLDVTLGQKLFGSKEHADHAATEKGKEAVGETSEAGATANLGRHPTVSGKAQETVAGIRERAAAMDEQGGYTAKAQNYYTKAIQSPFGQKVYAFYTSTSKQVLDIHEEAKRIASDTKSTSAASGSPAKPAEHMGILDLSLGPILLGAFLNVLLYGVLLTQVILYFIVHTKDKTWIKSMVLWLLLLDTLNSIFDVGFVYRYTIDLFGADWFQVTSKRFSIRIGFSILVRLSLRDQKNRKLTKIEQRSDLTEPLMTVTIASTTQCFFAWRVTRLTERPWIGWCIAGAVFIQFLAGAATTAGAWMVVDFARFGELKIPICVWLAMSAAIDVATTGVLTWYLYSHRTGFPGTDDVITRFIRLTVQTGLLTTIWALADLILYLAVPNSLHLLFNLPLCKLYTNSLMSTLNSRGGWGSGMGGTGDSGAHNDVSIHVSTIRKYDTVGAIRPEKSHPSSARSDTFPGHIGNDTFELSNIRSNAVDMEALGDQVKTITDISSMSNGLLCVRPKATMEQEWAVDAPDGWSVESRSIKSSNKRISADLALKPPAPPAEGQRPNPEPHKKTSKGRQLPEETEGGAESVGHRKVSARMDDENAMLTSNTRPLSAVADADAEAGPVASPLNLFLVPLSALLPASPSGGFLVVPPSTMLWSVPASMLGSAVPFANPSTVSSMSHSAVPHTAPLTAGLTDYRDR
ncbi:RNA recognition motif protein [Ceratobasidium sp. AG-Ba]|nr:RNA recognition motif protein [Ceratobasidium sp. AG-Ba]